MPKGIVRKVQRARSKIAKQITDSIDHSSIYSRGLASEGYNGGYIAALDDVMLLLNGVQPQRNGWWNEDAATSQERNNQTS